MYSLILACVLSATVFSGALAEQITYKLTGTVTSVSGAPVVLGQQIPIVFVIDSSYPRHLLNSSEAEYIGGSQYGTPDPISAASVNGIPVTGSADGLFIQKNFQNVSELSLFVSNMQPGAGLVVGLQSMLRGAVKNLRIPRVIPVNRFQRSTFEFFSGPPSYYFYQGTLNPSPYLRP